VSARRDSVATLRSLGVALGALLLVGLLGAAPASGQTPPANLTAAGASGSQIDLQWTGSGVFATYNVYRDSVLVASGFGSESYSDTGLDSFTEYSYFVTATVFGSESGPSNTVVGRTLDDSPPVPRPDILSATAVSTTQIDLTWSASSDPETGVAEYIVYREAAEVDRTSATSYSDGGLTPSTTYTYRVSAVNGDGYEGALSNPTNVKTLDPDPPPPPTNLTATTVSASEIDLSWTASAADDLTGYRVLRNGSPIAVLGLTTTYRDSGLQGFTTYNYTVTALDDEGLESGPSAPAQATTLDGTPPTVPSNLTADATGTTSIDLDWSASADPETGVAGYRVYRDGNEIATTTQTSYEDTGLSPATSYAYRVQAVNGQGLESGLSNQATATTQDGSPPTTPTNLAATAVSTDRIDLTWSASSDPESGVLGYRVYRDGSQIGQTAQPSYTDTGLSPATEYEYRVRAVNGDGLQSALSDPASATTLDATPPTAPQNLAANPVGAERIDLSWTASEDPESGIEGYRVFRDGSEVGNTTQTVFQADGLSSATEYDFFVVAVNGQGLESQPSATVSATTFDGTGPTTPADLTATAAGTDRIDLDWSAAEDPESGIAEYKVFRDGLEVGSTTETAYQDSGLDPATTYEYRVSAVNGEGLQGGLSDPASATTNDASGPTAPGDLTAEAVSQTQVNLAWSASEDPESGIDRYIVYRSGDVIGSVTDTSFADSGLTQNTTYTYSVSAVNGEDIEGQRSENVSATTFPSEDQIPPAPPTQLRVVTP
jgi:chitodextrinase